MTSQDQDKIKVLIAVPTYIGKDYIFQEHYNAIKALTYKNYEVIYLDNTEGTSYTSTLRRRGIPKVFHIPRGGNSRAAICNAQNFARHYAIKNNFDYLLFIESDLVVEPNTIQRMLSKNKPVLGSVYFIGDEKQKIPCIFFVNIKNNGINGTKLIHPDQVKDFIYSGLQRVHGCGLGCTLIRRDVFERFPFWYDERFKEKHSDVYFYLDLHSYNIPVWVDTDVVVKHFPSDWKKVKDK